MFDLSMLMVHQQPQK